MWIPALVSLVLSGWMALTLYESLREEGPSGWTDYLSTVWIAAGSMSGVVVAVSVLLKAVGLQ